MKFKQTVVVLGTATLLQFTLLSFSYSAPVEDLPKKITEQTLEEAIKKLKHIPEKVMTVEAPPVITAPTPKPPETASQTSEPDKKTVVAQQPKDDPEEVIVLDLTKNKVKTDSAAAAQKKYHAVKKAAESKKKAGTSKKKESKPRSDDEIRDALDRRKAMLAKAALGFRGTPYVWGGSTPRAFDCSGFTQYLYKKYYGINLPHNARMQFGRGKPVSFSNLQVGDLVFFNTQGPLTHVGMFIGNGKFIHAANPRRGVRVDSIVSGYYRKVYAGARRYR